MAGKAAAKRPQVSAMAGVWSSYKGGSESEVPDVETAVPRERILEIADRRGLPLVFPLLDTTDIQNVSFSDIWGGFDGGKVTEEWKLGYSAWYTL